MAFVKKTWLARLGQGLNKFIFNGGSKVTLESSPDTVTQQGTPLSAENMNDLEQRIADEFSNQSDAINAISNILNNRVLELQTISASSESSFFKALSSSLNSTLGNNQVMGIFKVIWSGMYTVFGLFNYTPQTSLYRVTGWCLFDISMAKAFNYTSSTDTVNITTFNP